jgi:putative addiction module killer protein
MEAKPRKILKYTTEHGRCPFDEWVDGLRDKRTQAVILNRLLRVAQGNFGLCRKLSNGISELKIDLSPGLGSILQRTGIT